MGDDGREGVAQPTGTLPTKRAYAGINVLILWGAVIEQGFYG